MHQSGFRRDTVWLFVTSYFVVMDVSSHFFFFHLNCQLLFRERKGWQVCAPDPDGHSTKREFVREPGLVLCSLWLIAIQNLSGSFIFALLRSQFKYFQLYRVEKKGKKMPLLYSHFFKLHLCSRVISQIIQLSLPVFILAAEAAPPAKMLNHYQLTEPLILTFGFSRGGRTKKTNSLHAAIPPAESSFDWTVPLNFKADTCLDQPAHSLAFLPSPRTCCWLRAEQVWHLPASPVSPFIKQQ